ncbi:MAG: hypothetical protein IPQ22_16925 [Rhodoferax sp.]|nr:hypothetical protein [Rhodoferax sp.]
MGNTIIPNTGSVEQIAADYLRRASEDLERAKRTRLYYVQAAKTHGMSNVKIGEALGVSEGRVRQMLARAE